MQRYFSDSFSEQEGPYQKCFSDFISLMVVNVFLRI